MARRTSVPGKLAKDIGKAQRGQVRATARAVNELASAVGKVAALSQAVSDRLDYAERRLGHVEGVLASKSGLAGAGHGASALKLGQWRADEVMPPLNAELAMANELAAKRGPLCFAEIKWLEWIEARKEQAKRAAR